MRSIIRFIPVSLALALNGCAGFPSQNFSCAGDVSYYNAGPDYFVVPPKVLPNGAKVCE